jgi:sec-independent protein translocase protein TatA
MQLHTLAFFSNLMGVDGIVLLVLGLLIFGRRLPEVGKNIGQTIVEFKKGLAGKGLDEPVDPEGVDEVPVNRNLDREKRQNRVTASQPRTKSLPTTEEV